jgi:REP element-mobilizing transposase RayT
MSYHPRIETEEFANFISTRCRNSELWFVNNPQLEQVVLGYLAKYLARYGVKLYGFAIEGNHLHLVANFPSPNRADFMRDLVSSVARAVARHTPEYPGGTLFGRRYSNEFIRGRGTIDKQFIYTALQPVQDGLVEKVSDYPGYNFFHDAVHGVKRRYKVVNWKDYNAALRYNPEAKVSDYTEYVYLEYARLPGYEEMGQQEYAQLMLGKLEEKRLEVIKKRREAGLGFAGRAALLRTKRGARPKSTKTSTINSHRARVLAECDEERALGREWYFDIYFRYKEASRRYRAGELDVEFPPGTYRPYCSLKPKPGD